MSEASEGASLKTRERQINTALAHIEGAMTAMEMAGLGLQGKVAYEHLKQVRSLMWATQDGYHGPGCFSYGYAVPFLKNKGR